MSRLESAALQEAATSASAGAHRSKGLQATLLSLQRLKLVDTAPSSGADDARSEFRAAAVHHLRGRTLLLFAEQYSAQVWDAHPRARRFFAKHRGLAPADGREQLPSYRALYLRAALAAAERAQELAPADSLECAALVACILWALAETGPRAADAARIQTSLDAAVSRALAPGCGSRHAVEVEALYGELAGGAASYAQRRSLLEGLRERVAASYPAATPIASEPQADWSPWSSPWRFSLDPACEQTLFAQQD
jgi:hypothetical protein